MGDDDVDDDDDNDDDNDDDDEDDDDDDDDDDDEDFSNDTGLRRVKGQRTEVSCRWWVMLAPYPPTSLHSISPINFFPLIFPPFIFFHHSTSTIFPTLILSIPK